MRANVQTKADALSSAGVMSNIFLAKDETSLFEVYNGMFEGVIADTEELIDECYKLRYQVYCVEHPFEEPNPEIGEYERDEFDGHSIHALLRYRPTGEFIGTVRLIMGSSDSPKRMPVMKVCEDNHIFIPNAIAQQQSVEISRLCISKDFRRRITDSMYATAYSKRELVTVRSRVIPFMALGLMSMVFKLCKAHDIHLAYAVMEPSLIRLLSKLGIYFKPIGEPVEYHGVRQVTYITNHELFESLRTERPDILDLMTEGGEVSLDY